MTKIKKQMVNDQWLKAKKFILKIYPKSFFPNFQFFRFLSFVIGFASQCWCLFCDE